MKLPVLSAKFLIPLVTIAVAIPVTFFLVKQQFIPSPTATGSLQYLIVNKSGGGNDQQTCCPWNWQTPSQIDGKAVDELYTRIGIPQSPTIKLGIGLIIPYLESPCNNAPCNGKDEQTIQKVLKIALDKNTPVLIKLDGFSWWETRSDLWNWWDQTLPGYNPDNVQNVEWTSWDASLSGTKIAWRNWGQQIRTKPHPNLASPVYVAEKQKKLKQLLPMILTWYNQLPVDKKYLLAGVVLDNELSIGVNFYYYPNGNDYITRPPEQDRFTYLDPQGGLSFGYQLLGYAAVKTLGIKTTGNLTESDLNTVIKYHADMLSQTAKEVGFPKDKIYIHGIGNIAKQNPKLFSFANIITQDTTPGWSLYEYAQNPADAPGLSDALNINPSQSWAAVEWLPLRATTVQQWQQALENTLNFRDNKLLAIYNWEGISTDQNALQAIRNVLGISTTLIPSPTIPPYCYVCNNKQWKLRSGNGTCNGIPNPPSCQKDNPSTYEGCIRPQETDMICESNPTPTPVPLLAEDIDNDGCVGLLDFNVWYKAIKGTPVANTSPDINKDGFIDLVDFNLWFRAMKNLPPNKLC